MNIFLSADSMQLPAIDYNHRMRRIIDYSTLTLLLLLVVLPGVTTFALEGSWTLSNHDDLKIDPSVSIEF